MNRAFISRRASPRNGATPARAVVAAVVATATLAGAGSVAWAAPPERSILSADEPTAVKDHYIVVFKDTVTTATVSASARQAARRHGGKVTYTYGSALHGFALQGSARTARQIAADPSVAYVAQDQTVKRFGSQADPESWGLDRIDQHAPPLDSSYAYPSLASGVNAYVLDAGVAPERLDFDGRATGDWSVDGGDQNLDCGDGHGTHVAGIIGGITYGVAKGVRLHSVRVFRCVSDTTFADVIAGVDWVTAHAVKPAVVNMSLGGAAYAPVDAAVQRSIDSGITYVIAAGNGDENGNRVDACQISPARVPEAITVGATDRNDNAAPWSNHGTCVDILAPGVDIPSVQWQEDGIAYHESGTSMAAPHVTGAAALALAAHPTWTPQQVRDSLVAAATPDAIRDPGPGTPNRLLYVPNTPPGKDFTVRLDPPSRTVTDPTTVTTAITTTAAAGAGQPVRLSVTGAPLDGTATLNPSTVTAGQPSTLSVTTGPGTPVGWYHLRILASGPETVQVSTFDLTVAPSAGRCAAWNTTRAAIPDQGELKSTLKISGCRTGASLNSKVIISIAHPRRGDIWMELVSPGGRIYSVKYPNRQDGRAFAADTLFWVNLHSTGATQINGNWTLHVLDEFPDATGELVRWSLDPE